MINQNISKCSKRAQKAYKSGHDWVANVIDRELCNKLIFDHGKQWYMHSLESIRENETANSSWILRYNRGQTIRTCKQKAKETH